MKFVWKQPYEPVLHALVDVRQEEQASANGEASESAEDLAFQLSAFDHREFELNCKDYTFCASLMIALGMAYKSTTASHAPLAISYGISRTRAEVLSKFPRTDDERLAPNELSFLDALQAHRTSRVPELPGIAIHKLTTGEAWHVTANECTSALEKYHRALSDATSVMDLVEEVLGAANGSSPHCWDDFLAYLEQAAQHDGFIVYEEKEEER